MQVHPAIHHVAHGRRCFIVVNHCITRGPLRGGAEAVDDGVILRGAERVRDAICMIDERVRALARDATRGLAESRARSCGSPMSPSTDAPNAASASALARCDLSRREEHAVHAVLDLRRHAHAVRERDGRRAAPERLAQHVAVRLAERRVHEHVGVRVEVGICVNGTSPGKPTRCIDAELARDALVVRRCRDRRRAS